MCCWIGRQPPSCAIPGYRLCPPPVSIRHLSLEAGQACPDVQALSRRASNRIQMSCCQVHGQPTLSSFALLEIACATGQAAADEGAASTLALVGASFGAASAPTGMLTCQLHIRSGSMQLCSMHGIDRMEQQQHLSGSLSAVREPPTSSWPMQGATASPIILGVLTAALQSATAQLEAVAAYCSVEPAQQDGFLMHPAAAEAVAGLQAVLLRPCKALSPATCGAVLCRSRRAAVRKLHASMSSRRRRRPRRAAASLAAQLCSGEGAFEIAEVEQAAAEPLLPEAGSYITIWQPVPEAVEAETSRWVHARVCSLLSVRAPLSLKVC